MEFRDAIKSLRNELGITQAELANALHIDRVTISQWKNGKAVPNRSTTTALMAYALALSVSQACCDNLNRSIANAPMATDIADRLGGLRE